MTATTHHAAQKRRLGRSDLEITPIGLGAWQLAGSEQFNRLFWRALPEGEADAIVAAALAGGINWFDTAEIYGGGCSEEILAGALQKSGIANGEVTIATKWFPLMRTAASIGLTIGERQRRLSPYGIDLYQVHMPYSFSSPEAEMDAMADLVKAGAVRAVGVSNFSARAMSRAHQALQRRGLALASNQVKYSLLDRRIEKNGVLQTARNLGITIIAYSPLGQGVLTGRYHRDPNLVKGLPLARRQLGRTLSASSSLVAGLTEIAEGHHTTPAQVALAWLTTFHGEVVVAIPGASRRRQAEENAGAMNLQLSRGELDRIDELSRRFM